LAQENSFVTRTHSMATVIGSQRGSISWLAVVRLADGVTLASHFDGRVNAGQRIDFTACIPKFVATASKLNYPGWRERCVVNGETGDQSELAFGLVDAKGVVLVTLGISSGQYHDRIAFQLLAQLIEVVNSKATDEVILEASVGQLIELLRPSMRELIRTYSDPSKLDKVIETQEKVDAVKGVMQDNVRKILETHASLEHLQNASASMSQSADKFLKQSVKLKQQLQLRNLKVKALTACCVSALVLYVSTPLISSFG
jgi:hypothetical protein